MQRYSASKIQATTTALQILNKATVTPKIDVNATGSGEQDKSHSNSTSNITQDNRNTRK